MNYPIIEYTNPCFPNTPYYKCTIYGRTYHANNLDTINLWRERMINTEEYLANAKIINDNAMKSFVKDLKNKD
jgi:hypothetical protein